MFAGTADIPVVTLRKRVQSYMAECDGPWEAHFWLLLEHIGALRRHPKFPCSTSTSFLAAPRGGGD